MGDTTISQRDLEDAVLRALPTLFPALLGTTSTAGAEFYDRPQPVVTYHDRDLLKRYHETFNRMLISVVLVFISVFVIPDFREINTFNLQVSITFSKYAAGTGAPPPVRTAPDSPTALAQATHYLSVISTSLLTTLVIQMVESQWLNHHASAMFALVIEHSRQRKRGVEEMVTNWRFGLAVRYFPVMHTIVHVVLRAVLQSFHITY